MVSEPTIPPRAKREREKERRFPKMTIVFIPLFCLPFIHFLLLAHLKHYNRRIRISPSLDVSGWCDVFVGRKIRPNITTFTIITTAYIYISIATGPQFRAQIAVNRLHKISEVVSIALRQHTHTRIACRVFILSIINTEHCTRLTLIKKYHYNIDSDCPPILIMQYSYRLVNHSTPI